jgi:hypothetical protein
VRAGSGCERALEIAEIKLPSVILRVHIATVGQFPIHPAWPWFSQRSVVMASARCYSVLPAFALGAMLAATPHVIAEPAIDPDIPSLKSVPEPRTTNEQIKLAGDYLMGRGVSQDLTLAAHWYEKAAGAGDPAAEMQTGYFYDAGLGVQKDPERAAHWYRLAAAGGFADAKVNLGILYLWGNGVAKNPELAVKLFHEAANTGSGRAAAFLGAMYYFGAGVQVDKAVGEQWFQKGAELHDPQAEYHLGLLLFDKEDHVHDLGKAEALLRESAGDGYVPAIHSLGVLLARNPELARSADEPARLFGVSADAGIWKSSMLLGVLARDGKGAPADPSAAYFHFRVATLQGGSEAGELLDNDLRSLAAQLGPQRIADLDAQASGFYRHHQIVLEFVYKSDDLRARFPAYALAAPVNGTHTVQILTSQPD